MAANRFLMIGRRFCGPPQSGNGGYTAGMLAAAAAQPVEIRLIRPPPLEKPLEIREDPEGSRLLLMDGEEAVASATPKTFELEAPRPPAYAEALAAVKNFAGFREHAYPSCFVCGPERARGDGMRIFASPIGGRDLVAAAWLPDPSLGGADGKVLPEFMWAALDCPGFFACGGGVSGALLGLYAARIHRRVRIGEPCVVVGWELSRDGRKHWTGTAVYDEAGEACGLATATWIEPKKA
ncbi:MAG: hypothetical protein KF822_07875 [Steroidobacteraceae bacterium]|nr:hypothetical protein [Steroidobacteraceae bacterium]